MTSSCRNPSFKRCWWIARGSPAFQFACWMICSRTQIAPNSLSRRSQRIWTWEPRVKRLLKQIKRVWSHSARVTISASWTTFVIFCRSPTESTLTSVCRICSTGRRGRSGEDSRCQLTLNFITMSRMEKQWMNDWRSMRKPRKLQAYNTQSSASSRPVKRALTRILSSAQTIRLVCARLLPSSASETSNCSCRRTCRTKNASIKCTVSANGSVHPSGVPYPMRSCAAKTL